MNKLKKKQQGISLIEIMVALTIGLILLLALASVYVTANRANKERSTNEILDESARQIFERLQYDLNNAGYVDPFDSIGGVLNATKMAKLSDTSVQRNIGRITSGGATVKTNYQAVFGDAEIPVSGTDNSLTVRYQVNPETANRNTALRSSRDVRSGYTTDCNGNDIGTTRVSNIYSLSNRSFQCLGSGNPVAQPLIENLADLRFRYVMTNPTTEAGATLFDSYSGLYTSDIVTATDVTASPLSWAGVIGVEVCVIIGGQPIDNTRQAEILQFQPNIPRCDNTNVARAAGDTMLYRRYNKILSIPNALYFTY